MVDIEIPLRAADRWIQGSQPYLASSFAAPVGYDLPFLYPPVVLPFLVPFTVLPRAIVLAAWAAFVLAAAGFTLRRLGGAWLLVPLILAWPPFAEGILGGNVQVLLVAAFVAVFVPGPAPRIGRGRDLQAGSWPRSSRRSRYRSPTRGLDSCVIGSGRPFSARSASL